MEATHPHQSNKGVEASRNEPCCFCGHEHFCWLIKDTQGKIIKVLCQWTDPHKPPEGWQHIGTAKDGRPIFAKLGYQRKHRGQKYPELIELNPQNKAGIPQWQDVHIPVEQAEKGHAVKIKPEVGLGNPETIYKINQLKSGKRQNKNVLLAVLTVKDSPYYPTTIEIAASDIAEVLTHDPKTGAKEQFIEYTYSNFKIVRHQWTDRRPVYAKEKTKQIRPYYQGTDGSWILGKSGCQWPLYRQSEAEATIRAGGIVFAVGGEQAVESLCSLGLTGVCNQGGESGYQQIAFDLSPTFAEATEKQLKPLLISWPDNDETGQKKFGEGLLKECYKRHVTAVAIDPLALWSDLPSGGDAKDWIDHCKESHISNEQMVRALEFAINQAIDQQEEENRLRWQREKWNSPTSYKGEIGRWKVSTEEGTTTKEWEPLCNFDFQVERELEDTSGGGLVIVVKRCFEQQQHRVILNSTDYTSTDTFVDALKAALGTGIVCNLQKRELGALIHTRLHEYRTNRQGKLYKRIERYGQQSDGTWIFRDRQYTSDGQLTSEEETGWVFSNVSSEGDEIPCPELAPENPKALKNLVAASRSFFGCENFYQVMLMMGWVTAGLHSQAIFEEKRWFPLINAHGEPGSCKTLAGEAALSLVGVNWNEKGMLARASTSAIYEHGSRTGALPFIWDDPDRNPQNEEIAKTWANWKARVVRSNRQQPCSPMGLTSNHVFGGDQAATYTRLVRVPFERAKGGANESFQELQAAQNLASGAFPALLRIGYPKEAIAAIERELLNHLPKAHARIAQALAIVVYYAQKVVYLAEGTEDIKSWVINHLCPTEDDADNAGDSLRDFTGKIMSLESESLVGDWNKKTVTTNGQKYIAIYYTHVWALVDKHYKPATYNLKSLKPLVVKAGGRVDNCTQKFDQSRDETLAYHRSRISHIDRDGVLIEPNLPRKIGRKAWLLPVSLFDDSGDDGTFDPNHSPSGSPPGHEQSAQINESYQSYQELPKSGNSSNLEQTSDPKLGSIQVTELPKNQDLIKIQIGGEEASVENIHHESTFEEKLVTSVTQAESQLEQQFQQVTRLGNLSVTGKSEHELTPLLQQPQQSQPTPIGTPAIPTQRSNELKVGDAVAHADSYMVAYSYHGVVEAMVGDKISVLWAERQGKPNERETYNIWELRKLE